MGAKRWTRREMVPGWYYRTQCGVVYACARRDGETYTMRYVNGNTFRVRNPREKGGRWKWDKVEEAI